MRIAPETSDEQKRLDILRQLDLLDTHPEEVFDALTRMAARLLGVPIALISLVDSSRQWFKSRVGIDATETPRDVAFCAHAILESTPFVVPDATHDARFADNPLVVDGLKIRAYAGVPLRTLEGHALGTLCAIDQRTRAFTDQEIAFLEDLGRIAEREIQNRETALRARRLADDGLSQARDRESLYQATFDRAAIGIAMVGLDGRWLMVNDCLCAVLGRTADDLKSMNFQQVTHPERPRG